MHTLQPPFAGQFAQVAAEGVFRHVEQGGRNVQLLADDYANGHDGFLIEAAAGLLDGASPQQRIRAALEEGTGYRVGRLRKVFDVFMSPGSVTERLHFFLGEYDAGSQVGEGGGVEEEARTSR